VGWLVLVVLLLLLLLLLLVVVLRRRRRRAADAVHAGVGAACRLSRVEGAGMRGAAGGFGGGPSCQSTCHAVGRAGKHEN
jgi:hypothetical protein